MSCLDRNGIRIDNLIYFGKNHKTMRSAASAPAPAPPTYYVVYVYVHVLSVLIMLLSNVNMLLR